MTSQICKEISAHLFGGRCRLCAYRHAGVVAVEEARAAQPAHHPHVDRRNAHARAQATIGGHSVLCAQFGTDAACPGPDCTCGGLPHALCCPAHAPAGSVRGDAVVLVREPFAPNARAVAETRELMAELSDRPHGDGVEAAQIAGVTIERVAGGWTWRAWSSEGTLRLQVSPPAPTLEAALADAEAWRRTWEQQLAVSATSCPHPEVATTGRVRCGLCGERVPGKTWEDATEEGITETRLRPLPPGAPEAVQQLTADLAAEGIEAGLVRALPSYLTAPKSVTDIISAMGLLAHGDRAKLSQVERSSIASAVIQYVERLEERSRGGAS